MENIAFSYEITESIAVLSEYDGISKELNMVSFRGRPAKYDIRAWKREDGKEMLLKGITLSLEEAKALKEALNTRTDI